MSDFLRVTDLSPDGLRRVLARADAVKQDPGSVAGRMAGVRVGLFFEKPSARTRISTEVATADLGAVPLVLKGDEIGLGKRESVDDVGRVFDRYLDVLALRVFNHDHLVSIADHADAPVINLLSDLEHPCQALADLQTVAAHRPLEGAVLTYVGDGNNVCHSLMLAAGMTGIHMRVASPAGYEPDAGILTQTEALAADSGGSIEITNDPQAAVSGVDVVYTDVWTSMGQEDEGAERQQLFDPFRVDAALFALAKDDAAFMHCLPAHRGQEVTDDVMDHPRSVVFDQAENRMHTFKALLLHLWT